MILNNTGSETMAFTATQIKAIQTKLKALGYYTRAIDGVSGPYTLTAIKAYQKAKGLLVDGIVGPVTAKALGLTSILFPTPVPPKFGMGYFINRVNTPLQNIDWKGLAAKGITEVYIRCAEENLTAISAYLPAIKAAGLKPYAWTWMGFSMHKEAIAAGWNICYDLETYNMPKYYEELKALYAMCKVGGKTFILCTKAQGWDGEQYWSVIKDYCDYLMPMLYLGDYGKIVLDLINYMKSMNAKYPGKIYPVLETYKSDANPVKKDLTTLQSEIAACKPYCKGLGLFRYGISPL